LLLAGAEHGVLREASIAAALLSDRDPFRTGDHARSGPREYGGVRSRSDLVDRVSALQAFHVSERLPDESLTFHPGGARNVLRAADQLFRLTDFPRSGRSADPATGLMRALLEAFPDRLARLRPGSQDRALMVGGRGIRIDASSRVRGQALFLAIELDDSGGEARVRIVSAVERDWLPDDMLVKREELFFNPSKSQVEARHRTYWCDLLLDEAPAAISDFGAAAEILAQHARTQLERVMPPADSAAANFRARVGWLAGVMPDLQLPSLDLQQIEEMLPEICLGLRSLEEIRTADWLSLWHRRVGYERLAEIDRLAPAQWEVPSGNRYRISYEPGKSPMLAVRIQELFGLERTPSIADGRVPLLLQLLGPNYRPQQLTSDLPSFWRNGYPEIRKELRRRYAKHAWPDDPLAAEASRSGLNRDTQQGN
jgi:ATP-dependent helicase HrpB